WLLGATLFVSMVASLSEISLFAFLGTLVDRMNGSDPTNFLSEHGAMFAAMSIVVLIVRPVAIILNRALVGLSLVPNLTSMVRWRNHRYVLRQSLTYFQNDFAGRIAQKVMQTSNALRETVVSIVDGVWFLVVYTVAALVLLIGADWRLAVPILIWIVLYALIILRMVPPVRVRSAALSEAHSALSGRVVDGYTNIQTVKLFAHAAREDAFAKEGLEWHLAAFRGLQRAILVMTAVLTLLNSLLIFSTAALAIWLWSTGSITLGAIALAITLVLRLNMMSGWILRMVTQIFEAIGTVENGIETLSQPTLVTDKPGAPALSVSKGAIEFDHVRFNYGRDGGVIDDLDLIIAPGERVGLVGPSGAGKSTLVNVLMRFYDLEGGSIRIDGQDIAGVSQESLRANIGMVTQDISLLHRSVRDNVRYGRPDADDTQIQAACVAAQADKFIPDLVDPRGRTGFDAHVGERGVKLSGGQRQRIAIARVILKDAPILLLDEATSALDSEVEAAIQDSLQGLMSGKTVIAIAHRLSTIAALDRLVVMNEGRIVEIGSHGDLLASGGLYASLWHRQSGGFLGGVERDADLNAAE
ncbi:MAG: ABC transporter ATP-binding protein, partial [Alphaproteobacteria bacterium]